MPSLKDFAAKMQDRAETIEGKLNELTKSVVQTIVNDLAVVTPVDTSQAISNWQVGLGASVDTNILPHSPGKAGSTAGASAATTISEARAKLATRTEPGNPVYITNALPYIGFLNAGSSRQAPAGFVERAVVIARSTIKDKRLL